MFGKETSPTSGIQSNKIFLKVLYFFCASNMYSQCCGAFELRGVYLVTPVRRQLETTTVLTRCKTHSAEVHRRCLPHHFTLSVKQDGKEGDPGDGGEQGDWVGYR